MSAKAGSGRRRLAWMALLVVAAGCAGGAPERRPEPPAAQDRARPVPVAVTAALATRRAMVVLDWPAPVAVTTSIEGRELLLRFGRPLTAPLLGAVPRRLPGWVDSVNAGHDTVLLRASLGISLAVTVNGPRVTIDLYRRPARSEETVIIGGDRRQ